MPPETQMPPMPEEEGSGQIPFAPEDAEQEMPGMEGEPEQTNVEYDEDGFPMPTGNSQWRKADLTRKFSALNYKKKKIDESEALSRAKIADFKLDMFKKCLGLLQEAGVNVHDQAAVGEFLSKLQATNPDVFSLFVMAYEGLEPSAGEASEHLEAMGPSEEDVAMEGGMPMPPDALMGEMPPMGEEEMLPAEEDMLPEEEMGMNEEMAEPPASPEEAPMEPLA